MECITSLLDQCLLYSDVSYQPFLALPPPKAADSPVEKSPTLAEPSLVPEDGNSSTGASSTGNAATNIKSPLLSIDLDFDSPVSSGLPTIRATTPLAKSANRRVGKWKAHVECNCYICERLPRSRPKAKPKKPSNPPLPVVKHTETSSTNFVFLTLPGEVREMIYRFLFETARVCINQKPHARHAFDLHLAIRSTCKTIYAETVRALFQCLSVTMIYEDLGHGRKLPAKDPLPDDILKKLQSLVIVELNCPSTPTVALNFLPSLRRVKRVHVDPYAATFMLNEEMLQDRCDEAKLVLDKNDWFSKFVSTIPQPCMVEYEEELWGALDEERSEYMGEIGKMSYCHIVVNCLKTKGETTVSMQELPQPDFEKRNEMYAWMEKDGARISSRSHAYEYLRRVEDMHYQAALNKIEAGIMAHKQKKQPPLVTGSARGADEVKAVE